MKFSFAQKSLACMLVSSITITAFAIAHSSKVAIASPQPPADVILDEVAVSQAITDQLELLDELPLVESDDDNAEAVADDSDYEMMEADAAPPDELEEGDDERGDEEPSDDDDIDAEAEQQEVDQDELQIQELVNDIRESSPDAKASKREELRNKLKEVLLKRTAQQQQRIEQMKRRLELVEQQLRRRVELSEQIVDRRVGELLEEQDELSWDHEPNVDPQDIDAAEAPVGEVMPATRKPGVEEQPVIVRDEAKSSDVAPRRASSRDSLGALAGGKSLGSLGAIATDKTRALQSLEEARVFAAKEQRFRAQAKELQSKLAELDKAKVASDLHLKALNTQLKREVDQTGLKNLDTKRLQMERLIELQNSIDEMQSKLDAARSEREAQRSPRKR